MFVIYIDVLLEIPLDVLPVILPVVLLVIPLDVLFAIPPDVLLVTPLDVLLVIPLDALLTISLALMTLPLAACDIYKSQTYQCYFFTPTLTLTLVIDHQLGRRNFLIF